MSFEVDANVDALFNMLHVVFRFSRGRRIHMLSDEEMKEMQPIKYVRYLKNVDWDEISKMPEEAKIVWEVAIEELKENNDKIRHLQAHVRQLGTTVQRLKNALKANKRGKQRGRVSSSNTMSDVYRLGN